MTQERVNQLFNTEGAALCVCVGSWKAYNECNEHGLGSWHNGHFYINFDILEGADELHDLLKAIGWSDAEMEETFIQDYESELFSFSNCDYINCFELADQYAESRDELLEDEDKTRAIIEYLGSEDFNEIIEEFDRVSFWPNMTGAEVMEELTEESGDIPDHLRYYIDYEAMARDEILSGYMVETSAGVLLI